MRPLPGKRQLVLGVNSPEGNVLGDWLTGESVILQLERSYCSVVAATLPHQCGDRH